MQKTKQKTYTQEVEEEQVPTQINESSAKVSEDACCIVSEIDDILAEMDEAVEPAPPSALQTFIEEIEEEDEEDEVPTGEWSIEWDGKMPDREAWWDEVDRLNSIGDLNGASALWAEYKRRDRLYRGRNSCVC